MVNNYGNGEDRSMERLREKRKVLDERGKELRTQVQAQRVGNGSNERLLAKRKKLREKAVKELEQERLESRKKHKALARSIFLPTAKSLGIKKKAQRSKLSRRKRITLL